MHKGYYVAVNGGLSPWFPWTECQGDCDHGVHQRFRSCTNPKPSCGGQYCDQTAIRETGTCLPTGCTTTQASITTTTQQATTTTTQPPTTSNLAYNSIQNELSRKNIQRLFCLSSRSFKQQYIHKIVH